MAGTAIIGSLAEALNLLFFFFLLSHCFHLIAFPTCSSVLPSSSVWPSLCLSSFSASVSLSPLQPLPVSVMLVLNLSVSPVSLCVLALCAGHGSLVSLLES